jgi:TPP-dependent pyruvate/acetoin dehydrogenase alpha subunit
MWKYLKIKIIKNNKMALPTPKTKLQTIAAQEVIVETARNLYNEGNQYDITKVPMVNGHDIGTAFDQAERAVEVARNNYNSGNQYDVSKV